MLTGGAASIPGIVDLAQEIFGVTVKLYVPNHMGLRNPVFTNVISIVNYSANLNEVYQLAKGAVTGEVMPTEQSVVYQQETNYETTYDGPQESPLAQDEETSDEGFVNKVKGFFSNIFE